MFREPMFFNTPEFQIAVAFVLGCIFWYVFWGLWFHLKWRRYMHKKCFVASDVIVDKDVDKTAGQMHDLICSQIDAACVFYDASKQDDLNISEIANNKEYFKRWVGWNHIKSILWLFASIGLGVTIYRVKDRGKWLRSAPPEDVQEMHDWVWRDNTNWARVWSFISLFIGGGALMSIIAFVLVSVMH